MANPCLTTAPASADPLTIKAKPGTIKLKLSGTICLDPAQTNVVTVAGAKVAFTCSAQSLSFTGLANTSYYVEILHCGDLNSSVGQLLEDCAKATPLATLTADNTFSRFQIDVA
jgi:hypothetical protein